MDPRFQLCTLDLDGTLIRDTCFLAVAEARGKAEEVRALDALYHAGKMTLEDNFRQEYAMLVGLPVAEVQAALRKGRWLADIPEGVRAFREGGLRVGILTDQPCFLAGQAHADLDPVLCSPGGVADGKVTAQVELRADKAAQLKAWCRANKVDLERVVHCGNGRNDVPVFESVGLAVAVNPDTPEVARSADIAVDGVTSLRQVAEVVSRALREM